MQRPSVQRPSVKNPAQLGEKRRGWRWLWLCWKMMILVFQWNIWAKYTTVQKSLYFRHLPQITKSDCLLRQGCLFVCPSAWNISAPSGRMSMKFDSILRRYVQKIQVSLKSDKNNWHFTWLSIYVFYYTRISFISS